MKFLFLGVILLDGELVIKYLYSLLASNKTCILQEHNHRSDPKKRSMILNKNDIKAIEWQLLWIICSMQKNEGSSRIMTSNYTIFFHLQSWLDIKLSPYIMLIQKAGYLNVPQIYNDLEFKRVRYLWIRPLPRVPRMTAAGFSRSASRQITFPASPSTILAFVRT